MRSTMVHVLKCWPEYFEPTWKGDKAFDIRRADRDFRVGDTVDLREWNPDLGTYTGRGVAGIRITYILRGPAFGLKPGWVILSLEKA